MSKSALLLLLAFIATGCDGRSPTTPTSQAKWITFGCKPAVMHMHYSVRPVYKRVGNGLAVTWSAEPHLFADEDRGGELVAGDNVGSAFLDYTCASLLICSSEVGAHKAPAERWTDIAAPAFEAKDWANAESISGWIKPTDDRRAIIVRGHDCSLPGRHLVRGMLDSSEKFIAMVWSSTPTRTKWADPFDFTNKPPPRWYGPFSVQLISAVDGSQIGPVFNLNRPSDRAGMIYVHGGWTKDGEWLIINEDEPQSGFGDTLAWIFKRTESGLVSVAPAAHTDDKLPDCWPSSPAEQPKQQGSQFPTANPPHAQDAPARKTTPDAGRH